MLPQCQAVAVREQLTSRGGDAFVSGNDSATTCP